MSKKGKKNEGFREWLSDNLRYILLIFGIFAVLTGLFFGVRAVSQRIGAPSARAAAAKEEVSDRTLSAASAAENTGAEAEKTESVSSADAAAPAASEAAAAPAASAPLEMNKEADVTKLVRDYYDAMSVRDAAAVQKITDVLDDEMTNKISSSKTTYTGVDVYTKAGPDEDSRVIYAKYNYKSSGQPLALPGLSQMYAKKGADGAWKLIFSALDEKTQAYIDAATAADDVQALIKSVKEENDSTAAKAESIAADPDAVVSAAETPEEVPITPTFEEETEAEAEEEDAPEEETAEEEEEEGSGTEEELADNEWPAVINSSCNVRSGAGYDYSVIGGVGAGTSVVVIGDIENGWWHIRTDEIEGYIGGKFID